MLLYRSKENKRKKQEAKQKDHETQTRSKQIRRTKGAKSDYTEFQQQFLCWVLVCVCGAVKKSKSQLGVSEQSIICAASLEAVTELLQVGNPVEMDERCRHNQNMENLMGMELRKGGDVSAC